MKSVKTKALVFFLFLTFTLPLAVGAFSVGDINTFNIESSLDQHGRTEVMAVLQKVSDKLFFYVESEWWDELSHEDRMEIDGKINNVSVEFENNIFPIMTSLFGSELDHPFDKNEKIAVLFHRMTPAIGGYFNSADQFSVFQSARSNERNILYINTSHIKNNLLESILAHEFMHLITFNQKERMRGVREEIWLNDVRAEYVSTLLGYNKDENNIVRNRASIFSRFPNDSLTEWIDEISDYGVVNIFAHYLVDHYGIEILTDSLISDEVGIASINEALQKNGHSEDFSRIFTDWTIAVLVNDCDLGPRYCFIDPNLKEFRVVPQTTFLPISYRSSFFARNSIKNWSSNWHRVVGGKGDMTLAFEGEVGLNFQVPYILCDKDNSCTVGSIDIGEDGKGSITIEGFGEKYNSLTFIPSLQSKMSGFNGVENEYFFNWSISTKEISLENQNNKEDEELRKSLLRQIVKLRTEIQRLQALIDDRAQVVLYNPITMSMSFGSRSGQVSFLQEFLKKQGTEIYPEGLITGNFLALTRNAVIRFQERYASEILHPLGLFKGTGYVGEMTKRKINKILSL